MRRQSLKRLAQIVAVSLPLCSFQRPGDMKPVLLPMEERSLER